MRGECEGGKGSGGRFWVRRLFSGTTDYRVCGFIQIESSTTLLDMFPKSSKLENAVEKQVILRVLDSICDYLRPMSCQMKHSSAFSAAQQRSESPATHEMTLTNL